MTHRDILDLMGSAATDAEADAMADILKERGITDLEDAAAIPHREFQSMIRQAIARATEKTRHPR